MRESAVAEREPSNRQGPLRWRVNRLRTMSAGEVMYRIRCAIQAKFEALSSRRVVSPPVPANVPGSRWIGQPTPKRLDYSVVQSAAAAVLRGRFDIFALHGAELGFPPRWLQDPKTGRSSPLAFGKTLDYRNEAAVGNIKYLWEPNRHLELVTLAQAYALSGDDRFVAGARGLLESWFSQCPYPLGVHWSSSLELAIRLVNWSVAWQLLEHSSIFASEGGIAFRRRWLDMVYLHQRFIAGHLSRYSSANNHLFGEYMGLFLAALTWPCWSESAGWRRRAKAGLEAEALKQNTRDGVNREQALWYHHEVADMMLLTGLAGRHAGVAFSNDYWRRLEAMLEFICSVIDVAGNVPMIGDADDAVMVRFVPSSGFNVYRSLLASGAVLFNRADFAARAGVFDDKSLWLLGDGAQESFNALLRTSHRVADQGARRRAFADGGYYVLGERFGEPDEVLLLADAGPLGYLSIAAHGHADALAFTLSVAGQPVLIDPGTYAYHTQQRWREYFKGTSAHNTVRVDEQDQSVSGGNFMWLRHARARCEVFETGDAQDRFVGAHDGYSRLSNPVIHRRQVVFHKAERLVEVCDELDCQGEHQAEVFWHFAEGTQVLVKHDAVSARCGCVTLELAMKGADFEPACVIGQEDPPLGWVSRSFDDKRPTPTVRWRGRVSGAAKWTTLISIRIEPHRNAD